MSKWEIEIHDGEPLLTSVKKDGVQVGFIQAVWVDMNIYEVERNANGIAVGGGVTKLVTVSAELPLSQPQTPLREEVAHANPV
jgi:hypothetical protein